MDMIFSKIDQKNYLSPTQEPFFLSQSQFPPPPNLNHNNGFDLDSKISSSLLLIIIILAIIFFVSGLLHLLVRYLLIPPNVAPDDSDSVTVLQGQLQQLFHLHDSGVDQSFIDSTLPVFNFKNIMGLRNPTFDCAVCLCEFECEDKLRLLPKCSHAFHMVCIDTWLLSHSTCPLCRASLLPDFNHNGNGFSFGFSPVVSVLESGSQSFSESRNSDFGAVVSNPKSNSQMGVGKNDELGDFALKSCENPTNEGENLGTLMGFGDKVVNVKLGKFKNVGGNGEGSCDDNADARRCFSMGSFEYVMDDESTLQVSIKPPVKKHQPSKKTHLPLTPGHRQAMSECGFETRRECNGFDSFRCVDIQESNSDRFSSYGVHGSEVGRSKRESFSELHHSRRAFSFRFPPGKHDDLKIKNVGGCKSEIGMARWENGGSELGSCDENGIAKTPSFARRTLLWLVGKQNKVVHSSFSGTDHV